jgi:hypothetical protein
MKLRLIACEVLYRELCAVVARSPHQIDIGFLPKGLHDIGSEGMVSRLQSVVDAVDSTQYDAIIMGYALCNNGVAGLKARTLPVVIPRGHDCMTLFFGSRQKYSEYFNNNPGTYFLTSGWIERGEATGELQQLSISTQSGMNLTYEQLVEKYGEENAKFLYDQLCDHTKHYGQFTFIEMGVEPGRQFLEEAQRRAGERQWKFDHVKGDMSLIERLVNASWDDSDFLVVPPGHRIAVNYQESIINAEPYSNE